MFGPALTTVGSEPMTEQSGQMRFGHRTRRWAIIEASVASVFGVPTILSCTPEQATELLAGRGSITFANDCEAGPTKTQFRVPAEPVNMRVSLPTKIGEQAVVEFVSIKRNDTVQLLDKWRTDVSPSWSSYCKPLPLLELLMKLQLVLELLEAQLMARQAAKVFQLEIPTKELWVFLGPQEQQQLVA
jgi:hypothetical protein